MLFSRVDHMRAMTYEPSMTSSSPLRSMVAPTVLASALLCASCGTREPRTVEAEPTSTGAAATPRETVMANDVPSVPLRAVCVEQPDGTYRPARVRGSIAGVYDTVTPIRLAHLNWMPADPESASAVSGCVTYPGASARTVACGAPGAAAAPVVSRTLCQQ